MSAHRLTKTSNKFIGLAVALALAFIGLATVQVPTANAAIASPANPYPFQCESKFYQATANGYYVYDPAANQYSHPAGSATTGINAMGYNPIDGYLYGLSNSTTLVRVSSDGKYQTAGTLTGVAAQTTGGDFYAGAGDNIHITAGNGTWTAINVATGVVSAFTDTGTAWASYDLAIKGNYGYGLTGANLQIATFTPVNGGTPASVNVQANVAVTGLEANPGQFGAAYIDTTGDAYFFSNNTGKLYRITAAALAAARTSSTSPAATLITTANTLTAPNDGASCSTAPSPFAPPVAAGDNYGVAPNGNFTANTNSTSLLAGDTSGIPLKVKSVTFGGTTLTDGTNGATIVSNGVTLTITDWTLGYFTLTGITTGITFTYTAVETGTSAGESAPRVTNSATVAIDPLIITKAPSTLTSGVVSEVYSNTMTATGSVSGTYYWTVSPALPAGLTLNSATGAITGTPTSAQSSATYTFSVGLDSTMKTSVSANYTLAVLSTAPVAATAQAITFTQPAAQPYVANATIVVAPTGGGSGNEVVVTSSTPSVCTVSATPTPYTITLVSTGTCTLNSNQDGGTNGGTTYSAATQVSRSFNVGRITTSSLTAGTTGTAYSATITQAGLTSGGTWAITDTNNSGLVIDPSTGVLSGTSPAAGTYSITFSYTANSITITKTISLVISAGSLTAQTITYAYTTPNVVGGPTITVAPTATSNLPVSLSTSSTACSVSGFVITILGPGACVIDADQPGNGTYAPATRVSSTFTILGITTASLPSGTVGSSYTASLAAAGTFGSCTYTTSTTLPSAIVLGSNGSFSGTASNPWTGNIVVTITCVSGGTTQTDTKSFPVSIAGVQQTVVAVPVIVVPPAPEPEPEPVVVVAPTPSPTPSYTPPVVKPSPRPTPTISAPIQTSAPVAEPVVKPTETVIDKIVRFLAGVFEGISTPDNNGDKATRSISNLADETLTNFAPGAGLRIEVIGSRIAGQFVAAPGDAGDPIALAKAIEESTKRNATSFANITNVVRIGAPTGAQVYSAPLSKVEVQLFAAAGLAVPSRASSFVSRTDKWVEVTASAQTYLPGTKVYLAVTSSPMIFGVADVGQDGKAMIVGRLPIGALENGGHSIRVVGIRSLDGISADKDGSIKISEETLAEIRQFDNGTKATLIITGNANGGGLQTLVREIPLERPVQWWTLWFALILGLVSLAYRYYYWRKAGKKQRKAIAITAAAIAGVPAAVVGWLDITYELWIGVAVAAVFVILNVIWRKKDMFENAFERVQDELQLPRRRK